VDGGTYFFTVNTFRRQPILTDADVRAALRAGIAMVRAEPPFVIDAWVLLPNLVKPLLLRVGRTLRTTRIEERTEQSDGAQMSTHLCTQPQNLYDFGGYLLCVE
jgi:hypothetical protein